MDVTFALMRLDQIEARICERHPRAQRDPHLAALLRSLRDDLQDQKILAEDN